MKQLINLKNNIILTVFLPFFTILQIALILIASILMIFIFIASKCVNEKIARESKYSNIIENINMFFDDIFNKLTGKF